jgi:hypothetical protein
MRPDERGEITQRVGRVLGITGRLAVASVARHLAPLEFPDASTAHRTVAHCYGLGLLKVHVPHMNAGNLVTLTARGKRVAVEHGADPDALHVVRQLGAGLAHLLVGNDLRVALALGVRARPDLHIDEVVSDLDTRRWLGIRARSRDAVIPDVLVRLRTSEGELRFAFEVDLASERSAAWRTKVRAFVDLYRAGGDLCGLAYPWRPVVVAPDAHRLRSLAEIVVDEGAGALWAGAVTADVVADPLGPHYASLANIARHPRGETLALEDDLILPAPGGRP